MKFHTVVSLLALFVGTASARMTSSIYENVSKELEGVKGGVVSSEIATSETTIGKMEKGKMGKSKKSSKGKMKKSKKQKAETVAPTVAPSPDPSETFNPFENLCYVPRDGLTLLDALVMVGIPEEDLEGITEDIARFVIRDILISFTGMSQEVVLGFSDEELGLVFGMLFFQEYLSFLVPLPQSPFELDYEELIMQQVYILTNLFTYPEKEVEILLPPEGLFWMFFVSVGTLCVSLYVP